MFTASWAAALAISASAAVAPFQPAPQAPPQPPPPDRPITRIFQNLGEDLKRFPALDTLVILGAGGAASAVASNSDHRVDRWTLNHPAGSWTKIGRVGGDGWMMGGTALGTWIVGEVTDRRLVAHVGSDLIRAQVLNGLVTRVLKIAVDRTRPSGGGLAFPSGHASAAFASAGVLQQHFGWKGAVPGYAAASVVALTRVRDRAHWVSDVVFGAAIGLASARAITRGHQSKAWIVMPAAVPGGAGIIVMRR